MANIYQKVMNARLQFLQTNPKKSGYNKFQNFSYYELNDIVPTATRICNEIGLYTHINILDGVATLTVVNTEKVNEKVQFSINAPVIENDKINNLLQDTGRSETYLRRYLYMLFLDIAENDIVDAEDADKKNQFKTAKQIKGRSKKSEERKEAEKLIRKHKISNLTDAKKILFQIRKSDAITDEECKKILKEFEVLLNGTGEK